MVLREHVYKGKRVEVRFVLKRCIHSGECLNHLPGVFSMRRRPWVKPDGDDPDRVAQVVEMCPTGALHYTRHDGGPAELAPVDNEVSVVVDGPLYVRGDVHVVDPDGNEILHDTRIALCRCGASRNRPFCDNAHIGAGFMDDALIAEQALPPVDQETPRGPLKITVKPNGSLHFNGPFRVHSGRRDNWVAASRAGFCRCGASNHKPFCDGTHRTIGFTTE
jgi:CDGSH-type Zn-finger protein/uncharacterized Fe-S cluster protein YjdI